MLGGDLTNFAMIIIKWSTYENPDDDHHRGYESTNWQKTIIDKVAAKQ